ncbi:MAG: zinc ribbon domain-containing protein [Proteobacteria bacterium]|nr:zinc ribbon domain-containing protein [Pseudomonadota bacterium]MBU1738434.1 zinc ribbon domain-containing protein [Pseudomonadota bacterium]
MPIFEYKCNKCSKVFEVIATSSEDSEKIECSKCGSTNVSKTISAGSYRVGSGKSSIPAGALSGCSSRSGFS